MKRRPILATALATSVLTLCSACYGSFILTQKVYELNGEMIQDKWGQSALFWAFSILPVYGIAVMVDAVILNLIEFWTGANPLADVDMDISTIDLGDGRTLAMSVLDRGETLRVSIIEGGVESDVRFFSAPNHRGISEVTNASGELVATAHSEGGQVIVANGAGELMSVADQGEVSQGIALIESLRTGQSALALR